MVKAFQTKYGLTNRQIALLCGCSLATIQKWRSGSVPVPGITQRLFALMDALFDGNGAGLSDFAERFAGADEVNRDPSLIVRDFSNQAVKIIRDREFSRAVEAQEQEYQTYFEFLPDMLILLKSDGTISGVNRKFEEQMGCRRDEVIGTAFSGLFDENSARPIRMAVERTLRGSCEILNLTLQHPDGHPVEVEAAFSSVRRRADDVSVICVLRNVCAAASGRNTAERKLRYDRLLSELRRIISGTSAESPDMGIKKILGRTGAVAGTGRAFFFQLSNDGLSIDQTVEWCADGVSSGGIELMRRTRLSIPWLMEKLRDQHLVAVDKVTEMEPGAIVEQQLMNSLGIRSALFALITDCGVPAGIVGLADMQAGRSWYPDDREMLRAVSDVIWSVLATGRSAGVPAFVHHEFETALQEAGVGFWQWDLSSGHVSYNGTWCAMLGYSPEEVEPRIEFWKKLIHPDDFQQAIEQIDRYLRDSSSDYSSEFRLRHRTDDWVWVQSKGQVTARDAQNNPVRIAGTHVDITRQKESELRLQAAKERIEKSNLVKSEFLSDMSHKLRTPMSSIIGTGQVLKQELQGAEQRHMADVILKSSDDMIELIDAILDIPGLKSAGPEPGAAKEFVESSDVTEPSVLIAEDNPANREVLKLMLRRLGCRTETAENGLEAVEASGRKLFDFIFMDIEMPVMNGLDAVREIRRNEAEKKCRATVICAVTAYAMPGDREKYLAAGMNEYIPKPISLDALSMVLSRYTQAGYQDVAIK